MDKQAFLTALRSGLCFLPQSEREEVMAEFQEHFEVGVERGHTEQELVDQLGDPQRIVETYRQETMKQGGLHSTESESASRPDSGSRQSNGDREPATTHHAPIHTSYPLADVRRVEIKLAYSNLEFSTSDAEVRVDIDGDGGCPIRVSMEDDVLRITQEWRFFRLLIWKNPIVRVALPSAFKGELDVEGTATDIHLPAFKGSKLRLHTTAGDFRLGEVYVAGDASISTVAGDVKGGKCMANELTISSTAGDVKLDLVTVEHLKFTTVAGDFWARMTDSWKSMRFKSVSGDIKLRLPEGGKRFAVELDSLGGSIKNELGSDPRADRTIKVKSVSGDVRIKRG